jgi:hypothetical protein
MKLETSLLGSASTTSSERVNPSASREASRFADFGREFDRAFRAEQSKEVTVVEGDTLSSIAKRIREGRGLVDDPAATHRLALKIAENNKISDPDKILVGQRLRLEFSELSVGGGGSIGISSPTQSAVEVLSQRAVTQSKHVGGPNGQLLDQVINRAVRKGYIAQAERGLVRQRIEQLSKKYGFKEDDFAKVALIESDGLNPAASNGSCHGIIQFCEGKANGAESAGMLGRAKDIKKMPVTAQLNLVDKYFKDVGLDANLGGKGLDDLYLSVLSPASRAETSTDRPLPIPGTQASILYTKAKSGAVITRRSLVYGINLHAERVMYRERPGIPEALTERQKIAGSVGTNLPKANKL